jgi:carbamoyltransferase
MTARADHPTILGLNRTQDASACLLRGPRAVSLQKERISRVKHHWGRLGDLALYAARIPELTEPVDLIVECYSSDREIERLPAYEAEIEDRLGRPEIARVSHHLAHAYSAFFPSSFTEAAVMVIDFQGSPARDCVEGWPGRSDASAGALEVASFYACRDRDVVCVGKQLWDGDLKHPAGLGAFYLFLTLSIFPGEGQEGKVMGLAPFGDPGALGLPPLDVDGERVLVPEAWLRVFRERGAFLYRDGDARGFRRAADLAAAGQLAFEDALLRVSRWLHARAGLPALCFAGGVALNCVANGRLLREGPFREVFVPPAPHDGGTAIGCALYGAVALRGLRSSFAWRSDFLGPEPAPFDLEGAARSVGLAVEHPSDLADAAAAELDAGRAIALFQGGSEFGPRALGHRSILAHARSDAVRCWLNARVKGREAFRPLAPVVLAEHAAAYFDVDRPLPFMQFAADVRPAERARVPAATHVDGTARIQTVGPDDDPLLLAILSAYYARSGVPALLNTSLNGPGEPLVETVEEALELFLRTPLHAMVAPPLLLRKPGAPELPARWGGT